MNTRHQLAQGSCDVAQAGRFNARCRDMRLIPRAFAMALGPAFSRPSRHKPLHPAHRTEAPKLDEPLISLDMQAIQGVVDLPASCDPHLTLDTLLAIGFASVPDEKRFDPIGSDGHQQTSPKSAPKLKNLAQASGSMVLIT